MKTLRSGRLDELHRYVCLTHGILYHLQQCLLTLLTLAIFRSTHGANAFLPLSFVERSWRVWEGSSHRLRRYAQNVRKTGNLGGDVLRFLGLELVCASVRLSVCLSVPRQLCVSVCISRPPKTVCATQPQPKPMCSSATWPQRFGTSITPACVDDETAVPRKMFLSFALAPSLLPRRSG